MKAMILAAGRGSRLRPLTDTVPKPLVQVQGQPLIVHHLMKLADVGVTEIVINHAWLGDQIEACLGDGSQWGVSIQYSPENDGGLETGGGVYQALPLLGDEPFILISADIFMSMSYHDLVHFQSMDALAHLVLVENPEHNPNGDFGLTPQGLLTNEAQYTYSGISVVSPQLWKGFEAGVYPIAPMWRKAIEQQQCTAELFIGDWSDVGTPERLEALNVIV